MKHAQGRPGPPNNEKLASIPPGQAPLCGRVPQRWGRSLFLAALAASALYADELHLRDGTVILGAYAGGSEKEVYFQHTPAGSEMYPLLMVESLKFNSTPSLYPGASPAGPAQPLVNPARSVFRPAGVFQPSGVVREDWRARLKWMFALFLPPQLTAQLTHPAH